MNSDFSKVRKTIGISISAVGVRVVFKLLAAGQEISIRIDFEWVGTEIKLLCICEAILVSVLGANRIGGKQN